MSPRVRLATFPLSVLQIQSRWRETPGFADRVVSADAYTRIAQTAESGHFDYLFVPDKHTVNTPPGESDHTVVGNSWPEPITLMSYLAAVTSRIGLVATASTAWNEPYSLARTIASLDHLSGGRVGWNAVSSHVGVEDHNFGHRVPADSQERHRRHIEFIEIVTRLWDSWEPDAVIADADQGRWAAPESVRAIDFHGEFFTVAGPLNVERSVQGRPLLFQAGASERFRDDAASTSDGVFTKFDSEAQAVAFTTDLRRKVEAHGREPGSVLVMPSATFSTDSGDAPFEGHLHFSGSPSDIAEKMISYVDVGACDGFTLLPTLFPDDVNWFVDSVVPELVERGALGTDNGGSTLRERLGLPAAIGSQ